MSDDTMRREKRKLSSAKYRAAHPDRVKKSRAIYYADHRDQEIKYAVAWIASHPEEAKQHQAAYYSLHREQLKKRNATWRAAHPEEIRQHNVEWRTVHRKEANRCRVAYHAAHPEKQRAANHRYRARKRGLPNSFDATDWSRALEYFHGTCAYCGNPPSLFDVNTVLHADHFIPLDDIEHCPGTVRENMLPACQDCNFKKGSKPPHNWLVYRFGKRKASEIENRIRKFFEVVKV